MPALVTHAAAFATARTRPTAAEAEHARRALANWVAAALQGASGDEGRRFLRVAARLGDGPAVIAGSRRPAAAPVAAWANGALAHVDDYDDTHLATVAHPATPVIAALLAAVEPETPGDRLLWAIAAGCEVLIRGALLLHPDHYDAGWHVTASMGGLGSALGVAALWGLDPLTAAHAGALAALQPIGLRAAFGTPGKPWQVGRAAEIGLGAAVAAREGLTGPLEVLEHPRGLRITTTSFHPEAMTFADEAVEFLQDTFKPYPCGIVTHPLIDAGRALHARGLRPEALRRAIAHVHPLVLELTDQTAPATGLAIKFSARTLFVVALAQGRVAPTDFADLNPDRLATLARWAGRVELVADAGVNRDAAWVEAVDQDGGRWREDISHARGSLARPLDWRDLEEKFFAAAGDAPAAHRLWATLRELGPATPAAAVTTQLQAIAPS